MPLAEDPLYTFIGSLGLPWGNGVIMAMPPSGIIEKAESCCARVLHPAPCSSSAHVRLCDREDVEVRLLGEEVLPDALAHA
eukprot:8021966-Pyramimonas_sp.AAC.1